MASEDVLERAESWLGTFSEGLTHRLDRSDWLISDLAAEVRELRAKLAEPWRHFSCPETSEPCDRMCLTMCHRRSVELSDLRDQVQTMLAGRMSASASEAEIRELRMDRNRLDAIFARRKVHAWNEELGHSVTLVNREMVDAWLEWEVSALVGDESEMAEEGEG